MRGSKPSWIKKTLIMLVVPVVLWCGVSFSGDAAHFLRRVGMVAAVLTMPEGGLMALENAVDPSYSSYPTPTEPVQNISSLPLPVAPSEDTAQESTAPPPKKQEPVDIPEEYLGKIAIENMAGKSGKGLVPYKNAYIKNFTSMTPERIAQRLQNPNPVLLETTTKPQVLIMHTHATESYSPTDSEYYDTRYNWRSTDNNNNMVAVGAALAKELEAGGIGVIHDTTQHDYPSYNGAYEKSEETVKKYLKKYPSIKIVFDVHRDAIERTDGTVVKPLVSIDGKNAAQLMIISCVDDGKIGIPKWEENFRFAANFNDHMETLYPGLTRPIFLSYRKYNQHLTTGSLLLEFGTHGSTLEEAKYTAELVGKSLVSFYK